MDEWKEHKTPKGRIYYYNKQTKESRWKKPNVLHEMKFEYNHKANSSKETINYINMLIELCVHNMSWREALYEIIETPEYKGIYVLHDKKSLFLTFKDQVSVFLKTKTKPSKIDPPTNLTSFNTWRCSLTDKLTIEHLKVYHKALLKAYHQRIIEIEKRKLLGLNA